MAVTDFTPLSALMGGALIGAASVLLMGLKGRIAGISGILVRLFPPWQDKELAGRTAFIAGIVLAPALVWAISGQMPAMVIEAGRPMLLLAGLLVGFGSVWGNGCTSGHGVCGLSRLSLRSSVAVATFMTTAIATVFILRHLL